MSPSLHLFLSFHQDTYLPVEVSNAPTDVVTDESAKGKVDARGIIEERRRLGEVHEENLPVVEKPTLQTVAETAAPDISKGVSTESGLDLNKAEERPDKGRKGVPSDTAAKSSNSKGSGSGKCQSSSGSRRPQSTSKAPKSSTSQKTSHDNYKKHGPREIVATANIPGFRNATSGPNYHS